MEKERFFKLWYEYQQRGKCRTDLSFDEWYTSKTRPKIDFNAFGDVVVHERQDVEDHFKDDPGLLHLVIDPAADESMILDQVKIILKRFRKTGSGKKAVLRRKATRNKPAAGRFRASDIEFYLKIYDAYEQGMELWKIIKKYGKTIVHKKDPQDVNTQRTFRTYLSKAKKIIQNVEQGAFPGEY